MYQVHRSLRPKLIMAAPAQTALDRGAEPCALLRGPADAHQTHVSPGPDKRRDMALQAIDLLPLAVCQNCLRSVRLLTVSRSGLQLLQRGPAGQVTALAADVWQRLNDLSSRGTAVYMVPAAVHELIRRIGERGDHVRR